MNRVVDTLKEAKGREPIAWLVAVAGTASGWISEYFSTQQWETTLNLLIGLCNPGG
jgi:hypothetical protein